MQCMYHLLKVPINDQEICATPENLKTWLHISLYPRMVTLYEYGRSFGGSGVEEVRVHNLEIVKKFKKFYKHLHRDGRPYTALRELTGECSFDVREYTLVQSRLQLMHTIWKPQANEWLDNKHGEQTQDPFRLLPFLTDDKKLRGELKRSHELYVKSKPS